MNYINLHSKMISGIITNQKPDGQNLNNRELKHMIPSTTQIFNVYNIFTKKNIFKN